ncbi:transmembrane protein 208-like [Oppia nitens]|uniref:transmembrane protein 208-like n=1 Tax=Oppia nitens TaxID=1686743 RepID=UPI0023D9E7F6|nr:transmembrane protein 208-like [Oppia nitens]
MAVQKGKAATKGQKQIVEDNKATLKFYSIMSITSMLIYILTMHLFFSQLLTFKYLFISVLSGSIYLTAFSVMKYMAKAVYSSTGALVDGGIDLNMESGFAEHMKDLIILTTGIQLLSLLSNYFWLLWLLAPGRGLYMLWVNVLSPWFFQQPTEQQEEVADKKQRKLERRMKRMQ